MKDYLLGKTIEYSKHFENIFGIPVVPINYEARELFAEAKKEHEFCRKCTYNKCDGINVFLYGCSEAYRYDGIYIYHCPISLVLVASSISNEKGEFEGGIVLGPACVGNMEDVLNELPCPEMEPVVSKMKTIDPEVLHSMSRVMMTVTAEISGVTHGMSGKYSYSQEQFLNTIYAERMKSIEVDEHYAYPIASERKLRTAVRNRDKEGSQILLNQLLAHIYISNNSDIQLIKPRLMELVVVISRAAIDAGADANEIFLLNQNFMGHIEGFKTIEELSAWISTMLQRFISYTFDFADIKHADVVYKTIEYIKSNYSKKLTLEEIAEATYLSKTYLSSIFKKETSYSISSYINMVRVDKSKNLLLEDNMSIIEIANACGFEDQSYYTKVFKNLIGITPKKYRENRGSGFRDEGSLD